MRESCGLWLLLAVLNAELSFGINDMFVSDTKELSNLSLSIFVRSIGGSCEKFLEMVKKL